MGERKYRINPSKIKRKYTIPDRDFVAKLTHNNSFELELLMTQVKAGKPINGQYFIDKETAKKEEQRQKYFGDEDEDGEDREHLNN